MNDIVLALGHALRLVGSANAELANIIALSLEVSVATTFVACLVGLPLGAFVAIARFPGRRSAVLALNAAMGLPPVTAGLFVYLLLAHGGRLVSPVQLFTPGAMILAQSIVVTPLVASLTRQVVEDAWHEYRDELWSIGASTIRAAFTVLGEARAPLLVVALAGFGRAASEVGAVMIVGGNLRGFTRVMTTTIAMETQEGDLPLALGLGFVLVGLILSVNIAAYLIQEWGRRQPA